MGPIEAGEVGVVEYKAGTLLLMGKLVKLLAHTYNTHAMKQNTKHIEVL